MKTIKSALLGSKTIIDRTPDALLFQLKEIIREHRQLIINRILSDIPTYLDYKFQVKTDKKMMDMVKEQLMELKNNGVDLSKYEAIVNLVSTMDVVHLTNEPFYQEIDKFLALSIQSAQLKMV